MSSINTKCATASSR